jgi:hypothetical protein
MWEMDHNPTLVKAACFIIGLFKVILGITYLGLYLNGSNFLQFLMDVK